jgi:excisionase family DNA binding protein
MGKGAGMPKRQLSATASGSRPEAAADAEREPGATKLQDVSLAALWLGCTPRFVRELVARRELPVVRIGRLVRFQPADLDAYIKACRQPAVRGPLGSNAA